MIDPDKDTKDSGPKKPGALRPEGQRQVPNVVLLIETSREFGRGLLHGIARYTKLHGPWRCFRQAGGLDSALPQWKEWSVDGAIMRDVIKTRPAYLRDIPTVYVQHDREDYYPYPRIITDYQAIGTLGAEYLLDRGFESFAYCGLPGFAWSKGRGEHFCARVTKAGFTAHLYPVPLIHSHPAWRTERYRIAEWLRSIPRPIGLMCCNDDRALQVVEACAIVGLDIPDDVAILGVDNDALICELSDSPISSIALNTEIAGFEAAQLLEELMSGRVRMEGQTILVTATHVVTRQSTDILAVKDEDVRTAIHFIRNQVHHSLTVDDVVAATMVSRRVLEKKFRATLRRSIHREIRRVRVQYIQRLLVGTDMSIAEIAVKTGFDGIEHIARYFRKETGMSLRDYRKTRVLR